MYIEYDTKDVFYKYMYNVYACEVMGNNLSFFFTNKNTVVERCTKILLILYVNH